MTYNYSVANIQIDNVLAQLELPNDYQNVFYSDSIDVLIIPYFDEDFDEVKEFVYIKDNNTLLNINKISEYVTNIEVLRTVEFLENKLYFDVTNLCIIVESLTTISENFKSAVGSDSPNFSINDFVVEKLQDANKKLSDILVNLN